jgi:hypothetical protein
MPHVDEMLGPATLAAAGLFAAIALQPATPSGSAARPPTAIVIAGPRVRGDGRAAPRSRSSGDARPSSRRMPPEAKGVGLKPDPQAASKRRQP